MLFMNNEVSFSYYFIVDRTVCFGDFLGKRKLCDVYHKGHAFHKSAFLGISVQ